MPEMRKNPFTGNYVIIAPERANRPNIHEETSLQKACPFCPGNENLTPLETLAFYDKNTKNWNLRVVKNKFPSVDKSKSFEEISRNKLEIHSYASGEAEVIVETPFHDKKMHMYSQEEAERVVEAYKQRYISISRDKNIKYICIFKNSGKKAGASISHSHSQIIAIPVVPSVVNHEMAYAHKYFEEKNSCIYCDMVKNEQLNKTRIISENETFISFVPYYASFPYEIMILPKKHDCRFETISPQEISGFAKTLVEVLKKLDKTIEELAYNFFIHTSPLGACPENYYHWHVELVPKTYTGAGFEMGTGIFVNVYSPEENASFLNNI